MFAWSSGVDGRAPAGDRALGRGELLGDVANGLAPFGEAPDDFVLLSGGQVLEADAVAGEGALDDDLVDVVDRDCVLSVVLGV